MATADQLRNSITPGSLPYGERQVLERALGDLPAQLGPQAAAAQAPGGVPGVPSDPLSMLASGGIPVDGDSPTAGLSVGPGPGPASAQLPLPDSNVEKYRILATQAKSPVLRHLARRALSGAVREQRRGI